MKGISCSSLLARPKLMWIVLKYARKDKHERNAPVGTSLLLYSATKKAV